MIVTKITSIPISIADTLTGTETAEECKVLGVIVNAEEDIIRPSVEGLLKHKSKTVLLKKSAASIVNSVYDSLGQAVPVVLKAEFLWQKFNSDQKTASWTHKLTPEEVEKCMKCLKKAFLLENLWFQRMIFPRENQDKKIIVFSDASDKAIGAVAYVVVYEDKHPISSHFFFSTNKTISTDKQTAHEGALAKWRDKHGKEYQLQ